MALEEYLNFNNFKYFRNSDNSQVFTSQLCFLRKLFHCKTSLQLRNVCRLNNVRFVSR